MAETIKEQKETIFIVGIGLIFLTAAIVGMYTMVALPSSVSAATETITVGATISEWLSFSVSTNTATISPALVDSGGTEAIGTSNTITLTAGTNDAAGYTITIMSQSNAGLCHSAGCGTHNINSGTSTLAAGTDGYGAQATSTDADVTVDTAFDKTGNDVGGITTGGKKLADTSGGSDGDDTDLLFKAAASKADPEGAYSDSVDLVCVGNT